MTAKTSNKKIIGRLLLLVVAMFGFGFALVPLYSVFCSVTGLNGKTSNSAENIAGATVDLSRTVKVQFVANLNENMPWKFRPEVRSVEVHPGQPTRISYYAENTTDKDIIGQAVPSVSPGLAASYFQKSECFCFTQQKLLAHEKKDMPVVFIVDASLPKDIHELTLSYTFFTKEVLPSPIPIAYNYQEN